MTNIAYELRRGVGNGDPDSVREAEELMDKAADEIERLRKALTDISYEYENQDVGHRDFRVWAKLCAEEALTNG